MFIADNWRDYEVLDTGNGDKLERWGSYILRRPDPQVIWGFKKGYSKWKDINAHYHRSSKGGGEWEFISLPKEWSISYVLGGDKGDTRNTDIYEKYDYERREYENLSMLREEDRTLKFNLKPFAFKHTGLFPEQAANWDWCSDIILKEKKRRERLGIDREIKVLNLFAYTGGATLACAKAGASLTHVDASKGMVLWAKENAELSGLKNAPIRWFVDDCVKLVERELRRGNKYDGIIMDPPSYGRGPKGEVWKIEDNIYNLLELCSGLLNKDSLFFLLNSYTTGLQSSVMKYMLEETIGVKYQGIVDSQEIGLPITRSRLVLPCGCSARWFKEV